MILYYSVLISTLYIKIARSRLRDGDKEDERGSSLLGGAGPNDTMK